MRKIIIKRLAGIRALLQVDKNDETDKQVESLKKYIDLPQIESIINSYIISDFSSVKEQIDEVLRASNEIAIYDDPEVYSLKYQIKVLEKKLLKVTAKRDKIEKLLIDFSIRYNLELGHIIERILFLRKEVLKYQHELDPEEKDLYDDYLDAESDFEKFHLEIEDIKKQNILTDRQQKELIGKYRKASKLCHPDLMDESNKNQASAIFQELKEAYDKNDIKSVNKILTMLETNNLFVKKSESITDKEKLKTELNRLNIEIKKLSYEIYKLQRSETFQLIKGIRDYTFYFNEMKTKLNGELDTLEELYKQKEFYYQ